MKCSDGRCYPVNFAGNTIALLAEISSDLPDLDPATSVEQTEHTDVIKLGPDHSFLPAGSEAGPGVHDHDAQR